MKNSRIKSHEQEMWMSQVHLIKELHEIRAHQSDIMIGSIRKSLRIVPRLIVSQDERIR